MAEYRTGDEYLPPAADPTLPARMSATERILCDKVPMEDFLGADSAVLEELLAMYREKNKDRLDQERQSQERQSRGQLFEVGALLSCAHKHKHTQTHAHTHTHIHTCVPVGRAAAPSARGFGNGFLIWAVLPSADEEAMLRWGTF